ncbi:hypothetical protein D9M68_824430 [compost metagenome]
MRRDEDQRVRRGHVGGGKLDGPSARRCLQPRFGSTHGLLGIERVQTGAARVAEQDDPGEAQLPEVRDACCNVEKRDFVLEAKIIADGAGSLDPACATGVQHVGHEVRRARELARMHQAHHRLLRARLAVQKTQRALVVGRAKTVRFDGVRPLHACRVPTRATQAGGHWRPLDRFAHACLQSI